MLEKPTALTTEQLVDCLRMEYAIDVRALDFLELGGDQSTAVYRAVTEDSSVFFCKLRDGQDDIGAELALWLHSQDIPLIIAPLRTRSGGASATLESASLTVYPFVEGVNGYQAELSQRQWELFGTAVRSIHAAAPPEELMHRMPEERFGSEWRSRCATVMAAVQAGCFQTAVSLDLQDFLRSRRSMILAAVARAADLSLSSSLTTTDLVLCHADMHPGNILVDDEDGLFIVDWDKPWRAPKERDLMFIGGGHGFKPYLAEQEVRLFYRGYGTAELDPHLLTYYRYERAITDVTVECERVLSPHLGDRDRNNALEILRLYFLPGCVMERAVETDAALFGGGP